MIALLNNGKFCAALFVVVAALSVWLERKLTSKFGEPTPTMQDEVVFRTLRLSDVYRDYIRRSLAEKGASDDEIDSILERLDSIARAR